MNAGTFPKPNLGTSQFISSIPQPTNVREDVVRIDHSINRKLQLMGHYLHDAVTRPSTRPLAGRDLSDGGHDDAQPVLFGDHQADPDDLAHLLNETAFLYSGNTIHLTPVALPGYSLSSQPDGRPRASSQSPTMTGPLAQINLGAPYNTKWSSSYFPWKNSYEGYEPRDDLSWTKGVHQFKFGFSWLHDPKNQQLQSNTQGTAASTTAHSLTTRISTSCWVTSPTSAS